MLGTRQPSDVVSVLAPIGHGFTVDRDRPRLLALGGGVGIPPMIFLAEQVRSDRHLRPLVLMGSEVPSQVRREFEAEIAAGRVLVVIDAPRDDAAAISAPLSRAGAVELPFEHLTALS